MRIRLGCAAVMVVLSVALFAYLNVSRQSAFDEVMEDRETGPVIQPSPPGPPRPKSHKEQIQDLSREQKYGDALELGRTFLKNGPDEARAAALDEIPRIVSNQYQFFLREKAWGRAREMLQEMAALDAYMHGDGAKDNSSYRYQLKNMQDQWRNAQATRLNEAIKEGNDAVVDALMAEIWDDPNADVHAPTVEAYLMKRWRAARDAGRKDEAERLFRKAVDLASGGRVTAESYGFRRGRVEELIRDAISDADLLAEGKRALEKKQCALASVYLIAFREPANMKFPSEAAARDALYLERLQRRLLVCEALLGLAREARAGALRFLKPDLHDNRLETLADTVCHFDREIERFDKRNIAAAEKYKLPAEAWLLRLDICAQRVDLLLAAGDYERAEREANDLLTSAAAEYYGFRTRRLGADRWEGVPAALRQRIEKA
ncbi:MAG: hypothetical protein KIS92_07815, partial [Planctomycetota bacterium]|nr:hypothetical protein [Planctomycetota bacterium]